jgi:GNAT superfamily N-acetyltransferase
MSTTIVRDFRAADAPQLNDVALAAFLQFKDQYSDWRAMANGVSKMSELAESGEVIVAENDAQILGGVVYVPGGKPKAVYFDQSWPIIRMLVVAPDGRGRGIGRRLTEECIRRARRDGAPLIALHTTPIMTVAQPMYLRMGFELLRNSPPIFGVPYAIYTKSL